MTAMPRIEKSICCGAERSAIYPRDCWRCGALFVPKKENEKNENIFKKIVDKVVNLITL